MFERLRILGRMILQSGTTLSQYRIAEKIGEGGMGVVWRASDTSLGRDVAIKVLPDLFSQDPERLARFEREARLLASLNHPNIAAIYGLHQFDGIRFLAMELVPGENLADRIVRGPLPADEALALARQIAEALEAAHDSGVVHRDLKPANIRIRPDGSVKVLDFGLAKALTSDRPGSGDPSMSPTVTSAGTVAGVVLGTAAYMSPEQVRGRPVDRRADIWSFGCVLYEMLSGRRLFAGDTVSDTMAAVLREEIDLSHLPAETPPVARHILARCLVRDPRTRLRDAGEARVALENPQAASQVAAARPATPAARAGIWTIGAVVLALLAGVAAGRFLLAPKASAAAPAFTFDVSLPGKVMERGSIAISPDGTNLVFLIRGEDGVPDLWLRPLATAEARLLPGTRHAKYPFWSPDGREVAFFAHESLMRLSLDGAAPRPIAQANEAMGGTWNADGVILFGTMTGPIQRVSAAGGGAPTALTKVVAAEETAHVWPQFLPGGDKFLFLADSSTDDGHRIYLSSLSTGAQKVLIKEIRSSPAFDPVAGLLLSQKRQLVAYGLNPDSGILSGSPVLIADSVLPMGTFHPVPVSVSASGLLAYQEGSETSDLVRLDLMTGAGAPVAPQGAFGDPALSPDGRRIAFEIVDTVDERLIWMLDIERGVRTAVSQRGAASDGAAWSADGKVIYFDSNATGTWEVYRKAADGGSDPERLGYPAGAVGTDVQGCSPDGRWLLAATTGTGMFDLYLLDLRAPQPAWRAWTRSPEPESNGAFSPDSRWIAYTSMASGQGEIYVAPVDGGPTVRRWQISSGGGTEPHWAPDGKAIFYRSPTDHLMTVPVSLSADGLTAGAPQQRFELRSMGDTIRNTFVLTPDGKSLILVRRADAHDTAIRIRTGWRPAGR